MAKHEIQVYENSTPTKTSAPYLGKYVTKNTIALDALTEGAAQLCGLPELQVKAIITGTFDEFEKLEKESLTLIHTDIGDICGKITGSFASADAAFDATNNTFELALYPTDDIRLDLVDETPKIVTEQTMTKVRVDQVMDVETPRPYSLIHNTNQFRIQGLNLVMTDSGACAWFETSEGIKYPLTIDDSTNPQLIKVHLASAPTEGCDGKVYVKSRGGDSEGPMQTAFRKVKFLYIPPAAPTITNVYPFGSSGAVDKISAEQDLCIAGTNFTGVTKVAFKHYATGSSEQYERVVESGEMTITDNLVTLTGEWWIMYQAGIDQTKPVTFEITTAGGTATRTATY